MKEFKKILRRSVINIECDVCKRSCCKEIIADTEEDSYMFEFATLSAEWGYWSDEYDGEKHECHLCERCYNLVRRYIEKDLKGIVDVELYSPLS